MSFDRRPRGTGSGSDSGAREDAPVADPRIQLLRQRRALQRKAVRAAPTEANADKAAQLGSAGGGGQLPHLERIQQSFGRHDVAGVRAHHGAEAARANRMVGAEAFASGNDVVFSGAPNLHTAAHEAAHVVQQRRGVDVAGGIDTPGDAHERHADEIADAVVAGRSAEPLLDRQGGSPTRSVQRRMVPDGELWRDDEDPDPEARYRQIGPNRFQRVGDDRIFVYEGDHLREEPSEMAASSSEASSSGEGDAGGDPMPGLSRTQSAPAAMAARASSQSPWHGAGKHVKPDPIESGSDSDELAPAAKRSRPDAGEPVPYLGAQDDEFGDLGADGGGHDNGPAEEDAPEEDAPDEAAAFGEEGDEANSNAAPDLPPPAAAAAPPPAAEAPQSAAPQPDPEKIAKAGPDELEQMLASGTLSPESVQLIADRIKDLRTIGKGQGGQAAKLLRTYRSVFDVLGEAEGKKKRVKRGPRKAKDRPAQPIHMARPAGDESSVSSQGSDVEERAKHGQQMGTYLLRTNHVLSPTEVNNGDALTRQHMTGMPMSGTFASVFKDGGHVPRALNSGPNVNANRRSVPEAFLAGQADARLAAGPDDNPQARGNLQDAFNMMHFASNAELGDDEADPDARGEQEARVKELGSKSAPEGNIKKLMTGRSPAGARTSDLNTTSTDSEQLVVASKLWQGMMRRAIEEVQKAGGKAEGGESGHTFHIAINRSPCRGCSRVLVAELINFWTKLAQATGLETWQQAREKYGKTLVFKISFAGIYEGRKPGGRAVFEEVRQVLTEVGWQLSTHGDEKDEEEHAHDGPPEKDEDGDDDDGEGKPPSGPAAAASSSSSSSQAPSLLPRGGQGRGGAPPRPSAAGAPKQQGKGKNVEMLELLDRGAGNALNQWLAKPPPIGAAADELVQIGQNAARLFEGTPSEAQARELLATLEQAARRARASTNPDDFASVALDLRGALEKMIDELKTL